METRTIAAGIGLMLTGWLLGGCRTTLHQTTMERVDQDLRQGNRGYLEGTPPPVGERNLSREMYELEIELPAGRVKPAGAVRSGEAEVPVPAPTVFPWQAPAAPQAEAPAGAASVKSYRVRKGDSLWKIANRPEVYGDGDQWRTIYEANRDKIADPNHLRAGIVLNIPPAAGSSHHHRRARHQGGSYEK